MAPPPHPSCMAPPHRSSCMAYPHPPLCMASPRHHPYHPSYLKVRCLPTMTFSPSPTPPLYFPNIFHRWSGVPPHQVSSSVASVSSGQSFLFPVPCPLCRCSTLHRRRDYRCWTGARDRETETMTDQGAVGQSCLPLAPHCPWVFRLNPPYCMASPPHPESCISSPPHPSCMPSPPHLSSCMPSPPHPSSCMPSPHPHPWSCISSPHPHPPSCKASHP